MTWALGFRLWALGRVHAGDRAIDTDPAVDAWDKADPLTDRECQVLRLAVENRSGGEISEELQLSEGIVRYHFFEAINNVGGKNRVDAARIARRKGGCDPIA